MTVMDLLPTGVVWDTCYRDHETGRGHPESFERFDAVLSGIRDAVPTERLLEVPAREATLAELHLCHAQDYVQSVLEDVQMGRYTLRTGDTDICSRSFSETLSWPRDPGHQPHHRTGQTKQQQDKAE